MTDLSPHKPQYANFTCVLTSSLCSDEKEENGETSLRERDNRDKSIKDKRGKDRERNRDRENSRDRERGRDRSKERNRDKEGSRERGRDRSRERNRDKGPKDRSKERSRERPRDRSKERSRERGRDRSRDWNNRDKESSRERDRSRGRNRDKEGSKERGRDRSKDRNRDWDGSRDREKTRDRNRDKDRNREGSRDGSRDRERDRHREGSRDRERDRRREGSRERRRDKDKRHDRKDSQRDDMEIEGDSTRRQSQQSQEMQQEGALKELGIEEMNVLRTKLGLGPLKVTDDDLKRLGKRGHQEREVEEVKKEVTVPPEEGPMTIDEKLEIIRKKREKMKKSKLLVKKSLGESDSDDGENLESALNWVHRVRQHQKEKELTQNNPPAAPTPNLRKIITTDNSNSASDSASDSDSDPVAMREQRRVSKGIIPNTTDRTLADVVAGMVVKHSVSQVMSTDGAILTLADKNIVSRTGNSLSVAEDTDELESVQLALEEKLKKNADTKAGKKKKKKKKKKKTKKEKKKDRRRKGGERR
eukprot:TRINITY_DN1158_c0_g1_i6.p1 TRINITY_DN1158_c0_g1~~TRINITY_DN1158_c0_g1_i6.p1  ORF type:complete len:546 (-),score=142.87 TRINITY_DN1158_c0_g1_i6:34-1629(-)